MLSAEERDEKVGLAIEIVIKVGLVAMVVYLSYLIAKPFMAIVLWAVIIAVAISPLVNSLEKRFGHRKKIIIGITIAVIAALLVPAYMLSGKMIESTQILMQIAQNDSITIPPPTDNVKEWPLIGEKSYSLWLSASQNLPDTLAPFKEQIKGVIKLLASAVGSSVGTVLLFIFSFIIAAALLLGREGGIKFYQDFSRRLMGDEKGLEWANISVLTIQSVVTGVIGVAVIQAVLALVGLLAMDIPFTPLLALGIMFLTIIQVPALLIIGPVIAYVFSQGSGTAEVVFAVYMLIVGASDGVLKPMLMGRGVDIPMLVILIGAIGGMVLMGMIGLFVGAVIFALAYTLFGFWMNEFEEEEAKKEIIDNS